MKKPPIPGANSTPCRQAVESGAPKDKCHPKSSGVLDASSTLLSHEGIEASELDRLDCLLPFGRELLPLGGHKNPVEPNWPEREDYPPARLRFDKRTRAVGLKTTGPLLCFDLDGPEAVAYAQEELGLGWPCWHVGRTDTEERFKLVCVPSPEQWAQLPAPGLILKKSVAAPKRDADGKVVRKGEAIEVFSDRRRQIAVWGEHPDGGRYCWPTGRGPELALNPPPATWWDFVLELYRERAQQVQPSSARSGTTRLDPCPICGRNSADTGLWCEKTADGLVLCMPGQTFNAELSHGRLELGSVVDGWALKKRTPIAEGDVLTFGLHQPSFIENLRRRMRAAART